MTHCAGYRAAALARSDEVRTIGLDAEPNEPLPGGVLDIVSLPAERDRLAHMSAGYPGVAWDRLLFCAKEAVYKAWFPLAECWLGFQDAEVTIGARDGTFTAQLHVPSPVSGFAGRWSANHGLIGAAITIPA